MKPAPAWNRKQGGRRPLPPIPMEEKAQSESSRLSVSLDSLDKRISQFLEKVPTEETSNNKTITRRGRGGKLNVASKIIGSDEKGKENEQENK